MKNSQQVRLLNVNQTARFLGLSPRTVYNGTCRTSKNPFPVKFVRIGKAVRFDIQDLEAYVRDLKQRNRN